MKQVRRDAGDESKKGRWRDGCTCPLTHEEDNRADRSIKTALCGSAHRGRPARCGDRQGPAIPRPLIADLVASGKLRVGVGLGSPPVAIKDPVTGELRGPAWDVA